jgi:hypothetical protein
VIQIFAYSDAALSIFIAVGFLLRRKVTAVNGAVKGVAGLLFNDAVSTVVVFNFEFDDDIVTF